jgi:TRAP-type C4-dicarboxylate transport system permease small subunit
MQMLNRFFENLEKVGGWINKFFVFLACVIMIGLVVIICTDNFLRYFLRSPLMWGNEVTEILLLYMTFLGAAWVFREDSHVVIDVFTHTLSDKKRKVTNFISYIMVAFVSWVLVYYGFSATYSHYKRGVYNPTAIETPIALIIGVVPIASIPLFLEAFVKMWKLLRK